MQDPVEADLQKALQLIDLKRYDRAKEFLLRVIAADPLNDQAFTQLALVNYSTGHFEEAEAFVLKSIEIDASYYYSLYIYSLILYALKKRRKAEQAIQQSLELNPEFAGAHRHSAVMYLNDGDFEKAMDSVNKALAIDPLESESLILKSKCTQALGSAHNANSIAREGLKQDPQNEAAWIQKGILETENSDFKNATESFRNALRIDPSNQQAKAFLLKALKFEHFLFSKFENNVARKYLVNKKLIIILIIPHFWFGIAVRSLLIQFSEYVSQWGDVYFRAKNYSAHLLSKEQRICSNIFIGLNGAAVAALITAIAAGTWHYYFLAYMLVILSCVSGSYFEDTENAYSKTISILYGALMLGAVTVFFFYSRGMAATLFILLHVTFNILFYLKFKILNLNKRYIEK